MNKWVISVLGQDRPGIIARVSEALFKMDGNIENVSQTIVQSEFAGIFIVSTPQNLREADVQSGMDEALAPIPRLRAFVKPLDPLRETVPVESGEPFVITTRGPDQKGIVSGITGVIARHKVNVTNMQAVFKGGDDPNRNIMIYEVEIPPSTDSGQMETDLRAKAESLGQFISIQHRKVFEAMNRV
jgi:glycine cleavage system transcriptional repressor